MGLAVWLHELDVLTCFCSLASLRQLRISLFFAGLAVRAKIDFATSWAIVPDPGVDSMVVLLRAIDMPRDMAASILMLMQRLRDGTHPQPPEALVIAMEAFARMEIAGARSVLHLRSEERRDGKEGVRTGWTR